LYTDRLLVGVDLAWKEGHTSYGVEILEEMYVRNTFTFTTMKELDQVLTSMEPNIVNIFIDAPLHLNEEKGTRLCDKKFAERGIPILPFNRKVIEKMYSPYKGFQVREFLERKGFKYCGSYDENSFFECYAFGNATLVFDVKKKRAFLEKWKLLMSELGFSNLEIVKNRHHIDALLCTLPYFTEKWEFEIFRTFRNDGYCLFVPW